jgi:hypothetical protein
MTTDPDDYPAGQDAVYGLSRHMPAHGPGWYLDRPSAEPLPTLVLTHGSIVLGMIQTPDGAPKDTAHWIGQGSCVDDLRVNVYHLDPHDGAIATEYASPNVADIVVTADLSWVNIGVNVGTEPGAWHAVEMIMRGPGSYQIVGVPDWPPTIPPPPLACGHYPHPRRRGATRQRLGDTIVYCDAVPWFALA